MTDLPWWLLVVFGATGTGGLMALLRILPAFPEGYRTGSEGAKIVVDAAEALTRVEQQAKATEERAMKAEARALAAERRAEVAELERDRALRDNRDLTERVAHLEEWGRRLEAEVAALRGGLPPPDGLPAG